MRTETSRPRRKARYAWLLSAIGGTILIPSVARAK